MARGKPALGEFDGNDVLGTSIAVTNAGDGLSAAVAVDPKLMHLEETVYVVLECKVADVRFVPVKDGGGGVVRVHKLKAGDAAIVDKDLVVNSIQAQRDRIEQAAGVEKLIDADGEPTEAATGKTTAAKKAPAKKAPAKKAPAKKDAG